MSRDRLQEPYASPRRIRERPKLETYGHNSSPARLILWLRSEGSSDGLDRKQATRAETFEDSTRETQDEDRRPRVESAVVRARKRFMQHIKAPILIGPTAECVLIPLDPKSGPIGSGAPHESCA